MDRGDSGAVSYVIRRNIHYPHITVGNDDLKTRGFHVTLSKGKHIFFKATESYPFCCPVIYDRVSMEELWSIFNYAKEYAMELNDHRRYMKSFPSTP